MSTNALNYDNQVRRLALGVEFEDALRNQELVYPVRAEIERESPHIPPSPKYFYAFKQLGNKIPYGLLRDSSGRYSLTYFPAIQEQVDIRIYDYDRHYIPRRLRVPLLTLQEVLSIEENEQSDYFSGRIRKVVMFPGASYQFNSMATGLRGRVLRNGEPMRWAYIEATDPVSEDLIIRTRGDDRGEFLLALPPHAARAGDLNATYDIRISIAGPSVVPVSDTPELQGLDNYWDLPIEELPPAGMPDNVASGESIPDDYVISPSAVRIVTFQVGRILTGREEADFEFSLP